MAVKIIGFIAAWALLVALQTAAQPSQQPTASDANLVGMADRVTESRYEWKVWRNKNWLLKDCARRKCSGYAYAPSACIGITVKKQCEQLGTVDYGRAKFSEAGFIKYCQKKCQANEGCNAINYIRFPEKEEKQPLCQLLKCPQPFSVPEVKASPAKDKYDNGDCYWNCRHGQDSSGDAYALERNKDYTFQ